MVQIEPSICWFCKNATGGCDWSRGLIPIKGWTARPITIDKSDKGKKGQYIKKSKPSFRVSECPEFQEG